MRTTLMFLLRRVKDLTQEEVSQGIGMSRSVYNNIELGRTNRPTKKVADAIGDYYKIPFKVLISPISEKDIQRIIKKRLG